MTSPTKTAWRARLRAARTGMDDSGRERAGRLLARTAIAWLEKSDGGPAGAAGGAGAICAYLSVGNEPPTADLLHDLAAGHSVYVPVCEPGFHLSWVRWLPGVALARSALAPVMEPVGSRLSFPGLDPVRAVLVPALAVDASGTRLGQGGGYYDRFLGGAVDANVAAVVYDQELFPAAVLPRDKLDMPVGFAVTPGGVHALEFG